MLYLGGNQMKVPYELSYVKGRFAVNGLALPLSEPLVAPTPKYTAQERAQIAFGQRVGDVADSLRAVGMSPQQQGEVIRLMCAHSSLVDSVAVAPRGVTWWFHGGGRDFPRQIQVELAQKWVPVKPVSQREREVNELGRIRGFLETGSAVFILGEGSSVIMPPEKADPLVAQARTGKALGGTLPLLEAQLRSPVQLERVK